MFIIFLFFVILAFNVKVQARDPKGTPLDELIRKKDTVCRFVSRTEINQVRFMWSQCIDSFILRPNMEDDLELDEFEELRQYYSFFCRDMNGFKSCWKNVTDLLNDCEVGRGNVAEKLYFAIYDLTCRNNGSDTASNIITSIEHGDGELCQLNYLTNECNETRKDWYSIDICRRYEAQKICELQSITVCHNSVHKKILLENLETIGTTLNCIERESAFGKSSANSFQQLNISNIVVYFYTNIITFMFLKEF